LGTCKGSLSPLQFFSSFQFQFQDSGAVEPFDPEVLVGEFCPKSESRFNKKPSRKNDSEDHTWREGDPQRSEGFQRDPQVRYFQSRKYSKLSIYFFGLQQTKKGVKTKTKLES
jgi:hypothetical protein